MLGAMRFGAPEIEAAARRTIVENAQHVVKVVDFARLDEQNFIEFISSDEFCADEIDIFRACVKYCEIDNRPIEKLLPLIRFPLMKQQELVHDVYPTKLLSDAQMVQLFIHSIANASETQFSSKPRAGAPSAKYGKDEFVVDGEASLKPGVHRFAKFEIKPNGVLGCSGKAPLIIVAQKARIAGRVDLTGCGFDGGRATQVVNDGQAHQGHSIGAAPAESRNANAGGGGGGTVGNNYGSSV